MEAPCNEIWEECDCCKNLLYSSGSGGFGGFWYCEKQHNIKRKDLCPDFVDWNE